MHRGAPYIVRGRHGSCSCVSQTSSGSSARTRSWPSVCGSSSSPNQTATSPPTTIGRPPVSMTTTCMPSVWPAADRPNSGSPRRRSAAGSRREGWALEHAWPVLDELGAAVEGAVVDHVEGDVGIAVVDAFRAGGTGDHGEHHDPEAIDDPGAQQRAG